MKESGHPNQTNKAHFLCYLQKNLSSQTGGDLRISKSGERCISWPISQTLRHHGIALITSLQTVVWRKLFIVRTVTFASSIINEILFTIIALGWKQAVGVSLGLKMLTINLNIHISSLALGLLFHFISCLSFTIISVCLYFLPETNRSYLAHAK